MKKYYKTITLALFAAALMIGAPYIKNTGHCGADLTIAFTGAILGCSGEKETGTSDNSSNSSAAVASDNKNAGEVKNAQKAELKVTFVELGSVNCIPCKMMQPVMKQVETTYPGQVKIVFHDVWTDQGRAEGMKYNIRVIPTQVFLDKNGMEYFRHEGFFSFEEVDKILKQKGVK
ncbi:MAG TPA: thioredoxin family protein [Spirochaetota bacterium]|nr:thioredoxin family protein [Spirochaetota bacterium]